MVAKGTAVCRTRRRYQGRKVATAIALPPYSGVSNVDFDRLYSQTAAVSGAERRMANAEVTFTVVFDGSAFAYCVFDEELAAQVIAEHTASRPAVIYVSSDEEDGGRRAWLLEGPTSYIY